MEVHQKPDLIVGIDFGMTCTGVAYANLTRGDNVRWVSKWPHRAQANENKVPTIVVYPKGSTQVSSWGFASENPTERDDPSTDYCEWFKTYLDSDVLRRHQEKDPQYAPNSEQDVERWYEDYLRLLYQHLEHKLGSELPESKPWADAGVEFIFSVPTTWQQYPTIEKFRTILRRAGYDQRPNHTVTMGLTEPEAAAVHTSVDAPGLFQQSEVILVCDAGGGTTDLSVMRIVGAFRGALTLQQLDVVAGKNIGSVAIDRDFEDYCASRLEQAQMRMRQDLDLSEMAWNMMKSLDFQNVKCDFGSPDTTPLFSVAIPGIDPDFSSEQFGISRGTMTVPSEDLRAMFDRQIVKLFDEVDKQLVNFEKKNPSEAVSHLVLSGGLGNSAYVQERLRRRYAFGGSQFACARDLQIHVAPEPQLAVCKGLVTDRVRSLQYGKAILGWRCARASYGTKCRIEYNPDNPAHIGLTPVKDVLDGRYYINDAIAWFVKKGEPINVDVPITNKFSRKIGVAATLTTAFPTSVIISHVDRSLLPLVVNENAEVLCEIESNLSSADATKFKQKNKYWFNPGKPYARIDYEIRTVIGPADLRFELWFDGQKVNKDNPIRVEWQQTTAPNVSGLNEDAALMTGALTPESPRADTPTTKSPSPMLSSKNPLTRMSFAKASRSMASLTQVVSRN